jgi:hypothetical protein
MEALKDIMEERPAHLKKVIGGKVVSKTLDPIPIGYCRATSNPYEGDAEFKRRVTTFYTTSGVAEREEINKSRYEDMHKIWTDEAQDRTLAERLQDHITAVRKQDLVLFDPYSDMLKEIIPDTGHSTSYLQHYYHMISGSAKFNLSKRETATFGPNTYVVATLEDHWTAYTAFYDQFIGNLKNQSTEQEQELFEGLNAPDWERWNRHGSEFLRAHKDAAPLRRHAPHIIKSLVQEDTYIHVHDYRTGDLLAIGGGR